jgi:hypothetical protein
MRSFSSRAAVSIAKPPPWMRTVTGALLAFFSSVVHAADPVRPIDEGLGKFFGSLDARVVALNSKNEFGMLERNMAVAGGSERFLLMLDVRRELPEPKAAYGLVDPDAPAMRAQYAAAKERIAIDVGGVKYRLHGLRGVSARYSAAPGEAYEAQLRRSSLTGKPRFLMEYRRTF